MNDNYFMSYAINLSLNANCIKGKVGAILVKDDKIIAEGVNSVPNGITPCTEETCIRKKLNLKSGENQELCFVVHAEQNALIDALNNKIDVKDSILYVTKQPCIICAKMLINAGIKKIIYLNLYTYDLPTIYGRFIDIKTQLKDNESDIKYETALEKLKLLFFELDNLLTEENKKELSEIIGEDNSSCLCSKDNLLDYLDNNKFVVFINKFHNNSKKWIRVRQTNDKTTIAVKNILADNGTNLQQMLETEIEVQNIKEANNLLEALGYAYKSYQEKERITYVLEGYELDIDTWPGIPTYVEVEGKSETDLENILNKLDYSMKDTVSCTADEIYEKYGLSMFDRREIKFENYDH